MFKEEDALAQGPSKITEGASKNLKDYDCWDTDLKPQ